MVSEPFYFRADATFEDAMRAMLMRHYPVNPKLLRWPAGGLPDRLVKNGKCATEAEGNNLASIIAKKIKNS